MIPPFHDIHVFTKEIGKLEFCFQFCCGENQRAYGQHCRNTDDFGLMGFLEVDHVLAEIPKTHPLDVFCIC